jgi:hypothetical protein
MVSIAYEVKYWDTRSFRAFYTRMPNSSILAYRLNLISLMAFANNLINETCMWNRNLDNETKTAAETALREES